MEERFVSDIPSFTDWNHKTKVYIILGFQRRHIPRKFLSTSDDKLIQIHAGGVARTPLYYGTQHKNPWKQESIWMTTIADWYLLSNARSIKNEIQ